ncbi:ATP-binding protein [Streptomyces sp. LP05-1]|uniref:ATP-binding protein n=1 Tax=Streptomyces pyxinae TaxID=2970734 RepID=A0ABT2C9M7_9ACTN|nr:ATP-binding protein [Streptomyces sp. LP05-1]MCS0634108.1 ATP-binding protein [Streptomyces sp. LP05-1]
MSGGSGVSGASGGPGLPEVALPAGRAGRPDRFGALVRRRPLAAVLPVVRDLRGRGGRGPRALTFAAGDLVVVSGLPGSGKSTLIARTAGGLGVDSQDARDRWERRMPGRLPYAVYRPLVRAAHYWGLRRALRAGAHLVVHDCGTQVWVRRWLAREARRRGRSLHLLLLDVAPDAAREGQRDRGRGVSRYAFARHRAAAGRLVRDAERGVVPAGCASVTLLDRLAATALRRIGFGAVPGERDGGVGPGGR